MIKKQKLPSPLYRKRYQSHKRVWYISISLGGRTFPEVSGKIKKEVEAKAAHSVLEILAEESSLKTSDFWIPSRDFPYFSISSPPLWKRMEWIR